MSAVRVAIVDVGANTLRLLVAVPDGPGVVPVHEEKQQLGLGEEVERYGYISAAKCAEAVEVAQAQTRRARRLGCERIEILVTSPGRQSGNSEEFAEALRRGTGAPVRILSSEEEGALAWSGAVASLESPAESIAVCDVGGGSAQLVVAAEEFSSIVPPVAQLGLAAGGTARALRRVTATFDADGLAAVIEALAGLKRSKISKRYGIPPQRAATLLAGTILLAEAQRRLGLPLGVAEGGLREGSALALFRESVAAYA